MKNRQQFREQLEKEGVYKWDMFWEEQYALYASGCRDIKIHDTTLVIMAS